MLRFTTGRKAATTEIPPKNAEPRALPGHVAIIMDGNGRWATKRGLPRIAGHKRGINSVRKITRHAKVRGVKYLTLFAFSTENWLRPKDEVHGLFDLFRYYMRRECQTLAREGVRIRFIGDPSEMPEDIQSMMIEAQDMTAAGDEMTLIVALNYGSRAEIVAATQRIAAKVEVGYLSPDDITDETLSAEMNTADFPDPDLIIRTSGEQRLSNFLLWQAAYSEFLFVDCHWPDFDEQSFDECMTLYQHRDRRFGGLRKSG
jgi:undecaprenyl diphosphate synthase